MGELPDNLQALYASLRDQPPAWYGLPAAVLALGDSSYGDSFCAAGEQVRLFFIDTEQAPGAQHFAVARGQAQGLQGQIPLWAGGGIGLSGNAAADAFKMICLGANGVIIGKILIQLLGCVGNEQGRCNSCNTGKCPMGICSQDPRLVKRLDIDRGAQKIVDYVLAFDAELKKLMAPIGNSSLPIGRSDALVSTDKAVADKLGIQYVC